MIVGTNNNNNSSNNNGDDVTSGLHASRMLRSD